MEFGEFFIIRRERGGAHPDLNNSPSSWREERLAAAPDEGEILLIFACLSSLARTYSAGRTVIVPSVMPLIVSSASVCKSSGSW